jgi:predicted AlkP superfamily phosphohydrolase/phosphomutase
MGRSWLPFARRPSGDRRVFVLSLEGVPHSFLARHLPEGAFPNLAELFAGGSLCAMGTAHPPVSSVVWSTYMTGRNPGRHGVYGHVERRPASYALFVPDSADLSAPTLWEVASRAGRRPVVVNVPGTFPPRPINGVLISPSRGGTLEELVYPRELGAFLRGIGYRAEVDTRAALDGAKDDFLVDAAQTLRKRFEAAFSLLHREPWDFFQFHVSETDRLNHFLWEDYERDTPGYGRAFLAFYRTLDALVGELLGLLPRETEVLLLSGHGFRRLRREIYVNHYLEERGWLLFEPGRPRRLEEISGDARAYSLAPGRVYLHLKGREPKGRIHSRDEYHGFREGIAADLLRLKDPENGQPMVAAVLRGEEVNRNPSWREFPLPAGDGRPAPCDLLVVPAEGYELKGNLDRPSVTGRTELTGMHAYDDGFFFVKGRKIRSRSPRIEDVFPTVLALMGVDADERPDGECLL